MQQRCLTSLVSRRCTWRISSCHFEKAWNGASQHKVSNQRFVHISRPIWFGVNAAMQFAGILDVKSTVRSFWNLSKAPGSIRRGNQPGWGMNVTSEAVYSWMTSRSYEVGEVHVCDLQPWASEWRALAAWLACAWRTVVVFGCGTFWTLVLQICFSWGCIG